MRTIIHDLNNLKLLKLNQDDIIINNINNKNCIGCFNCWLKTPMNCTQNDKICDNGKKLLYSDELVIISKNICGCYSSKVKKILERSIGYVLPYFTIRENEIHHQCRSNKQLKLTVYFYDKMTKEDMIIAKRLVKATKKNLNSTEPKIYFLENINLLKENI